MGHGTHSTGELIAGAIAFAILWSFVYAIIRAFERKKPEEIPQDILAESLRVVSTPMQLPGGRWGMYETKLVECAPPMAPTDHLHFPLDAEHRKGCKRCQQEYSRGMRMPHAN